MLFTFDEQQTVQVLDRLSARFRTVFAAACASRLVALLSQSNSASPDAKQTLAGAIGLLRNDIRAGDAAVDWQAVLDGVISLLPDENETAYEALLDDTVSSVAYAIRTKLTGSSQEAAWSARRCYEYFDLLANQEYARQGIEAPSEEMLLEHPETKKELKRQRHLLHVLQHDTVVNPALLIDAI